MSRNILRICTLLTVTFFLCAVVLLPRVAQAASTTFYLHGTGTTANPATLFLDKIAPVVTVEKYKDSPSLNFNGGNAWKDIGTWSASASEVDGILSGVTDLRVWLGLKNSDDIGTRFDLRAEIMKNGTVIATGETRCIQNIVRNANQAKEVTVALTQPSPEAFNGSTDILSVKLSTRIGTNPDDTKCTGHNNAVGLRLYFDASDRAARFSGDLSLPTPTPTVTPTPTATPTPPPAGAGNAYIVSSGGDAVTVVDTATSSVTATIPVGDDPRDVAYHPVIPYVYVSIPYSHRVDVVDTTINAVITSVPVAGYPLTVKFSPDGSRVYAVDFGPPPNVISVIDTATNTVVDQITGVVNPLNIIPSPDGTRVYVVNSNCCDKNEGWISVHETTTYAEIARIPVGIEPLAAAITPDGNKLYVSTHQEPVTQESFIYVVNTTTNTVTAIIPDVEDPYDIAINSTGTKVYVAETYYSQGAGGSSEPGKIAVIDTASDTIVQQFSVGRHPIVEILPDDSRLYVANTHDNNLQIYDPNTYALLVTLPMPALPNAIATKQ